MISHSRLLLLCCMSLFARPSAAETTSTSRIQPRIIGGDDVKRGEFPYFVEMGNCGGVLIAPGIALSAAHCREILLPGVYVTIGPHGIKDVEAPRVKIVERQFHPWYWKSYDMILLRLEEPIYFDDSAVELTVNDDHAFPLDGSNLTGIGFGTLKEGSNISPEILQKVEMQAVNLQDCNETLNGCVWDDAYLCAGTEEGGKDTCQGDSGGPLVYIDGNQHTLVGLTSWGEGCGDKGIPAAYARVSMGMDWISTVVCDCWRVEGASFCEDPPTSISRTTNNGMAAEETWTCPYSPSPYCVDKPGYMDYKGYTCASYEETENPGCEEYGGWHGGPGFEDTNSWASCCWCGGGTKLVPPPVTDFERDPECKDVSDYIDSFKDDCTWYEANTEPGCGGWGTITGGSGFRDVTPDAACCHCGGGIHPTPAPSPMPMPSNVPTQSAVLAETPLPTQSVALAETPLTDSPTIAPFDSGDPNSHGADNVGGSGDSGASTFGSWASTVAIIVMVHLFLF